MRTPGYTARLIRPFARVLATYEGFDAQWLDGLDCIDPAGRVPVAVAHALAVKHVALSRDEDLGLKAAHCTAPGAAGAVEYAISTAPTMRIALEVGAHFANLFSDALRIGIEVDGKRVRVRMQSTVPTPRPIADHAMATWYSRHADMRLDERGSLVFHFKHPRPSRVTEYERAFGSASLHFGADCCGFDFGRECLEARPPAADPALHVVLCDHVARMSHRLRARASLVEKMRQVTLTHLSSGHPAMASTARTLGMSTRTLAKRLEEEGTTFRALLDELRRELAISYLRAPAPSISAIARRLGFSHVEAFSRAFKRWTGEPPGAFRRARHALTLGDYASGGTTIRA